MITVLGKYNGKHGIIELPATDGEIKKFCGELGADSVESFKIQYAGTGEYWGTDSALLENTFDGNARFNEINLLSYITSRMDEKQMSEFDEKICDFKGDFCAESMKPAMNEGYRNLSGEEEVLTVYDGENVSECIAAERNMLKPYPEMNKDVFWQMIDDARQKCGGDYDMIQTELTGQLSLMCPQDILLYKDINDEYVRLANREGVYEAGCGLQFPGERSGFGDDGFTDFRGWLIGQGKDVYMNTMKNPDSLLSAGLKPYGDYYEWECFNYIAYDAYKQNTGSDLYDQPHEITQEQKDEIASEIEYGASNEKTQESELAEIMRDQGCEVQNETQQALDALKLLIERERSKITHDDGYVDEHHTLKYLSDEQADIAMRYDVPIGFRSHYADYHGSHKGDCSFRTATDIENYENLKNDRTYEYRAALNPGFQNPNAVIGYINQVQEIEQSMQPEQESENGMGGITM